MAKIVYVAALSHSGSTLLGLLLGNHPSAVCLGEVHPALTRGRGQSDTCTCGAAIERCPVWGPADGHPVAESGPAYATAYRALVERAAAERGPAARILDVSKRPAGLQPLLESWAGDVQVIWLLKDIRSFVYSQLQRSGRPALMRKDGWRRLYTTTVLFNILQWRVGNGRIKALLRERQVPFFQLGYEELCFRPETMLRKVCEFLGLPFDAAVLRPDPARGHLVRGNRVRQDPSRLGAVAYDAAWMRSARLAWWSDCMAPLMGWNAREVYANTAERTKS